MRPRRLVALAGISLAASTVGVVAAERRWARADDPTGGGPLDLPDGVDSVCVTEDGARLAVRTIGTGDRDVVLSHCWMGSRRYWGGVARRLVDDGFRVVVYDQRGHGDSTIGEQGLTLTALGHDLASVLDHVDATDAVVGGHSMGGMTVQVFAIEHPDVVQRRVRGLALVGTACAGMALPAPMQAGLAFFVGHPRVQGAYRQRYLSSLLMRGIVGRTAALAHLDAQAETLLATPAEVRLDLLRTMSVIDLREGLPTVALPTVVLCGSRDLLTPVPRGRQIATLIPGARFEVLPGAGHMLPWETPDAVAAAIRELALDPDPPTELFSSSAITAPERNPR